MKIKFKAPDMDIEYEAEMSPEEYLGALEKSINMLEKAVKGLATNKELNKVVGVIGAKIIEHIKKK